MAELLASGVGAALVTPIIAYKTGFPKNLFSIHATLMSGAWMALIPFGVKQMRLAKKEPKKESKDQYGKNHVVTMACTASLMGTAIWAIFQNKERTAASKGEVAKHIVSRHAKFGVAALLSCVTGIAAGIAYTYFNISPKQFNLAKFNRRIGYVTVTFGAAGIITVFSGGFGTHHFGKEGKVAMSFLATGIFSAILYPAKLY